VFVALLVQEQSGGATSPHLTYRESLSTRSVLSSLPLFSFFFLVAGLKNCKTRTKNPHHSSAKKPPLDDPEPGRQAIQKHSTDK